MPMIPESIISLLATAHLGAVHTVVFGGFSPAECAKRIVSATPKIILTASCGIEGSKVIPYLPLVSTLSCPPLSLVKMLMVEQRLEKR